jgi:hypothetical protein
MSERKTYTFGSLPLGNRKMSTGASGCEEIADLFNRR